MIPLWVVSLLLLTSNVYAKTYHHEHQQGWHWYQDPKPLSKEKIAVSPTIQMKNLRTQMKQSLDTAILDPSTENVKKYMAIQNDFSQKASRFSNVWQQVLLENPSLNYSLTHPTNAIGNQVYLALQREKEETAMTQLAKQQGLFFFYSQSCPYCQRFAPILKQFAERHQLAVLPITLDGGVLPEFPHSVRDQGQARAFQVKTVPAVFTVNPYSGKATPVAYGIVSESELRTNMLNVATQFGRKTI